MDSSKKNDKAPKQKIVPADNDKVMELAKKGMDKYKKALEKLSKN